jgi:hypothetical protein
MNTKLPTKDGQVALLNVGDGDTTLSFDPKNPAERLRAARIVADMLKRGYALMVRRPDGKGGEHWVRVKEFDETQCEYLVADFDSAVAAAHDQQEENHANKPQEAGAPAAPRGQAQAPATKRGRGVQRVPAASARTVAIAPVAGG